MDSMITKQASTILQSALNNAQLGSGNTISGDFISVATTALKTGYDPVLNALSQMWGKTIFSIRPYTAKFKALEMDATRWGNATRKVSIADNDIIDDNRFTYPVGYDSTKDPANGDGLSVDMFTQRKPKVLQTNFYGQSVYENYYTIFKDQLDTAFTGAEDFVRFNAMVSQNRLDKLEQARETVARTLIANLIASVYDENNSDRVIHLLTEYNTETGLTLNSTTVYQPDNFAPFMRWVYARIATLAKMMSERSNKFQTLITGYEKILRHTDPQNLQCYLYTKSYEQIKSMTLSTTYNDGYMKLIKFDEMNFFQDINNPNTIKMYPTYTGTDGLQKNILTEVKVENVLGVLFDDNALGYSQVNAWNQLTPFNAKGGYWNDFDHVTFKTLQDMTEKAVVLLLD